MQTLNVPHCYANAYNFSFLPILNEISGKWNVKFLHSIVAGSLEKAPAYSRGKYSVKGYLVSAFIS